MVTYTHPFTHPFNGPFSGITQVSWYQKGKTNLDFSEARDSEWQWHQQGHMQVCTSLQTDNHASTPPLSFLQAGCMVTYVSVKSTKVNQLTDQHLHKRNLILALCATFITRCIVLISCQLRFIAIIV